MTRNRSKHCDYCQLSADTMYRIQADRSNQWQFACNSCWLLLSVNNPDYVYGGTWKARKS
jgi:hypothetical protein